MPVVDLHHIAIKTADVDRTARFYNEVLGTRTVPRPPFSFPGAWLMMGSTMIHLFGGDAAIDRDGRVPTGGAAVDHVALMAHDFDAMRRVIRDKSLDWRENDIPSAGLWQIFVHDPNHVLIELNFPTAQEPKGSRGPDGTRTYVPNEF